jgi:Tfp pilus assembly protein PilE
MGQQQLLLIILGVIIVGIAVAVGITMFQDNAIDQNRSAVIADLTTLAAKAQQFYAKPVTLGGGGNSFAQGGDGGAGLTATPAGLAYLASPAFTTNANGTYTIKTAGTGNPGATVVLHGVGAISIDGGVNFPEYDMTVTASNQVPTKIK